jgi:iron complex outermembrane receptor protein
MVCLPALARAQAAQNDEPPIELTVQGTPLHPHEPSHEDALSGSVVRRERLQAPELEAADVLRRESGVEVVQYGGFGAAATASIRGATAAQTPVYLGGIRLNDEVAGAADLSQIPLWLIDRIEIYRGNAPLYADELGIGGALVFEPVRPQASAAGAGISAGSFGTSSGFAWAAAGNAERASLVGVEVAHADNDYEFDDNRGTLFVPGDDRRGVQQNVDVSELDAWAIHRVQLPAGARVDVLANAAVREQGVPRLALSPSREARARYQRLLLGTRARLPFGSEKQHELELATSFVGAQSIYDDPNYELDLLVPRVEITGRRAAQRALARFELSPRIELTSVLDLSLDQLLRQDGKSQQIRAQAHSGRVASGLSFEPWSGWFLLPLLGLACRSPGERGGACDQHEPVGRIAIARRERLWTVFAGVGRYVRFPTLGELYGGGVLVRGNSHLGPERGVTSDLGFRAQYLTGAFRLWADAAAYTRFADDLVSYVRSSQGFLVPINVQAARVSGIESAAGAEFGPHVATDLALTVSDPRDVTPERKIKNDILPFHSRFVGALGLNLSSSPHLPGRIDSTRGRVSVLHQSSRYADPAGLVVIPAQTTLDLELEQGFSGEQIKSRARVANVLDAERFDVVGYPLPGRSVFVSMEILLK